MRTLSFILICAFVLYSYGELHAEALTPGKINNIEKKVAKIHEGITTQKEVLALFGEPGIIRTTGRDRTVMVYHFFRPSENRPINNIPLINMILGTDKLKEDVLTIIIDPEGKVEKYTLS